MAVRHQRKRHKGFRLPEGVVCVTRPGMWGNPFVTLHQLSRMQAIARNLPQLRGRDLACWCAIGKPCHADVLIDLANREQE